MFKKPFKVKSQIQLKSSEKKKLANEIKSYFPALTDEDISFFSSNKESIMKTKITAFNEELVEVYVVEKVPMFFDVVDSNVKLPTIFMLWKFPHMIPMLTTNGFVLEKLKNGADLFLPGIMIEGLLLDEKEFQKKDPIGINVIDNKAALAVGLSLVDRKEILPTENDHQRGKVVAVYHTVNDNLYKFHPKPEILKLGPPDWVTMLEKASPNESPEEEKEELEKDEEKNEIAEDTKDENVETPNEELNETVENQESVPESIETENVVSEKDKMDELLEYCFLKALKTIPKSSYPILPATFYANHILTGLPEGENLNIKKTKWKKFSAFLQDKSLEGLIKLQKSPKNDYTILGAETSHRAIREFVDPYKVAPITIEPKVSSDGKPVVQQIYSVSAATLPFFAKFGLKKNDELTRNDVRNHLNDYIKIENLVHAEAMDKVVLDPILYSVVKGNEVLSRADLLANLLEKMSIKHKVSNCANGDSIVHKGKMPMIEFEVVIRTGNKKVTLISNLESYGVNVNNFSKELQQKAAASTTITPVVPGKKGPQIQVQGNQIVIASNILKEKHNINEKFMKGLDKAPKPKKK